MQALENSSLYFMYRFKYRKYAIHAGIAVFIASYMVYCYYRNGGCGTLHLFCILWALGELCLSAPVLLKKYKTTLHILVWDRLISAVSVFECIFFLILMGCYLPLFFLTTQETAKTALSPLDHQYVLILGAQLQNEQMNEHLYARLHVLLEHMDDFPADRTTYIVSGGTGRGHATRRTEASCMYEYLTANGIPKDHLIREEASVSTYENLKFTEKFWRDSHLTVISSDYHLPRIHMILQDMGYEDYSLIGAPTAKDILPYWALQEALGLLAWKIGIC